MWTYTYPDELYHYGVKGMKWGVKKAVYDSMDRGQRRAVKKQYLARGKEAYKNKAGIKWYDGPVPYIVKRSQAKNNMSKKDYEAMKAYEVHENRKRLAIGAATVAASAALTLALSSEKRSQLSEAGRGIVETMKELSAVRR